jgi:hypothetical protein
MFDKRPDVRAQLGYTPTFLDRQNVSGSYGDNDQDFFLTVAQNDWSGGEGQFFWRDTDGARSSYYTGSGVYVARAGEISIERSISSSTPTQDALASCGRLGSDSCYYVGSTNLYSVTATGSETDLGAHGAGTPNPFGMCLDGKYVYIAGASDIRSFDGSSTFATFSTVNDAGSLAYLNNALYSCDGSSLCTYDGSGNQTVLHTWKDGKNVALATGRKPKLVAHGATLLIFWPYLHEQYGELWEYNGDGVTKIAELPHGYGGDAISSQGVVFLSSVEMGSAVDDALTFAQSVVYAYVNGQVNELWRDSSAGSSGVAAGTTAAPVLGVTSGNLIFTVVNSATKTLRMYDLRTGAITTLGAMTYTANSHQMASCRSFVQLTMNTGGGTKKTFSFYGGGFGSTGTIQTSLFDFDNTLTKTMRGVTVEWVGTGASCSVDIAYKTNSTTGSYTALQTNAVSGTEYLFPAGTTGRSISIKLTLNDAGHRPTVKRLYVRAAPKLQSYRRAVYLLDLSGRNGNQPGHRHDGTPHPLDGLAQLANLRAALGSVVSITDAVGTYSGVIETGGFQASVVRSEEFVATVPCREV